MHHLDVQTQTTASAVFNEQAHDLWPNIQKYAIFRFMFQNRRIKSFICQFIAFLLIGTSYHCAFEELFATISTSILGEAAPSRATGCAGTTCGHQDDASQAHEHGQSHQLLALKGDKASIELNAISIAIIPLLPFLILASRQSKTFPFQLRIPLHAPPEHLKDLITSLTFAPQAPPLPA